MDNQQFKQLLTGRWTGSVHPQ